MRIGLADLAADWQPYRDGWASSASTIEPFVNPFIEALAAADRSGRFVFCVRERNALESVTITIDPRDQTLRIRAGSWGTAPLYLMQDGDTLLGSWDPAELYERLDPAALNFEAAAPFIAAFAHPYSRRTMFDGVLQLTERSVARWSPHEPLTIDYPEPIAVPRPRTLREGANPPAIALEILTASMQRWLVPSGTTGPQPVGSELSSGLDSAIVAAVATDFTFPLQTYGLLQNGEPGIGQRLRRQELIGRFAFVDTAIDAHEFPPLAHGGARIVPWEEIYYDAAAAMLRSASRNGMAAMLTGIGGDELCLLHRSEDDTKAEADAEPPAFLTRRAREALRDARLDIAPRPAIAYSSLEGLAASAPLYLHHGIWPIAPLTTPELFTFARSLPAEWRRGRRLSREMLARRGCSRLVTHPHSTETFSPLFRHGFARAARPMVRELFAESHLADMGLVDAHVLRATYDDYCEGRVGDDFNALPLYATAVLELALRRMCSEVAA
ncbi:MAG TPA: asparagine synthase-related protein [Thermoanaerobaculia bacterium]|nr:asparagine synthase-related protein [Thermoanaerobaculia bacterium]